MAPIDSEETHIEDIPALDFDVYERARDFIGAKFDALVQVFLEDARAHIEMLKRNAENDLPAEQSALPAHTLKSTSGQLGLKQISALAYEMERASNELARQKKGSAALAERARLVEKLFNAVEPVLLQRIAAAKDKAAAKSQRQT
jgi:HPt (histidine-containing phosphotransfer) domain-containing protein